MLAVDTAPDTQDVSLFLSTLILTGDIEASVSCLYEHVSEVEREARVRTVIEGMYSQLPKPVAVQIQERQEVITGRVAHQRQKIEIPSGRKYTVFGGCKKFFPIVFVFWVIVFGAGYAVLHHYRSLNGTPSRSESHSIATRFSK